MMVQKLESELGRGEMSRKIVDRFKSAANDGFKQICCNNKENENTWIRNLAKKILPAVIQGASAFFTYNSHPKRSILTGIAVVSRLIGGLFDNDKNINQQTSDFAQMELPLLLISKSSSVDLPNQKEKTGGDGCLDEPPPPYTEKPKSGTSSGARESQASSTKNEMCSDPCDQF